MDEPDNQLITQAAGGDADALTALLKEHGPRVRRSLRISPTWQSSVEAEDVMQVTYMEAYLQIGGLRTSTSEGFVAWLRHIADNNLRDAIKQFERLKRPDPRKKARPAPGVDSYQVLLEAVGASSSTASKRVAGQEVRGLLSAAISRLPAVYETVIRLYDLEGRPVERVAAALERSAGAVYMLRARAHDHLRRMLGPESDFFSHTA